MDLSILKGDQVLQRITKADDPVDILKAIGHKDIRHATPKYLSSLDAILTTFGVSPETIGYWCSRLSKALADKKIPDKNDMLDMLVLDTVSHTNNAVLATADEGVSEMLKGVPPCEPCLPPEDTARRIIQEIAFQGEFQTMLRLTRSVSSCSCPHVRILQMPVTFPTSPLP